MKDKKQIQKGINLFKFLQYYYTSKNPVVKTVESYLWHQPLEKLSKELGLSLQDSCILTVKKSTDEGVFNHFYTLYAKLKKEPEQVEVMLGDYMLTYKDIYHPLIAQPVTLIFDATIPEFKIYATNQATMLYKKVLNMIEDVDEALLLELFKGFDEEPITITHQQVDAFITQLHYALKQADKEDMAITKSPLLFLARKQEGIDDAVSALIDDIEKNKEIPPFIADIVGASKEIKGIKPGISSQALEQKLLLTKPVNDEQLLVAKQLQTNSAVLVQGPPGTGKTHTIANLLGHLLAEGKNVLVTSYSEKALNVIKSQITQELRPLCLSLLSTTKSRQELEETLEAIHDKRATSDINELTKRITVNEKNRQTCISALNKLDSELKSIRKNDQTPIKIAGKLYKPLEAAQYVQEYHEQATQIKGQVRQVALPLSTEELDLLKTSHVQLAIEDEQVLACTLPKGEQLLAPEELEQYLQLEQRVKSNHNNKLLSYIDEKHQPSPKELASLIEKIKHVTDQIELEHTWCLEIIKDGKEEKSKEKWHGLVASVKEVYQLSETYADELITYNPKIEELDDKIKPLDIYSQVSEMLEKTGKISKMAQLFNKEIKIVIEASTVNDRQPQTLKEFEVLTHYTVLEEKKEQLKLRWNRQMGALGAKRTEHLGTNFEEGCYKYTEAILENLAWYNKAWEPVVKALKEQGILVNEMLTAKQFTTNKYQELKYIREELRDQVIWMLQYRLYKLKKQVILAKKLAIEEAIVQSETNGIVNTHLQQLKEALHRNNVVQYKAGHQKLNEIRKLTKVYKKRVAALEKLSTAAPEWTRALSAREVTIPDEVEKLWLCKQLKDILVKRQERTIDVVKEEMHEVQKRLEQYTKQLASDKAWLHKLQSYIKDKQQIQSLESWKQVILKIGAGKGRQVNMLRQEAKQLMPKCQKAIPAWIMPLSKVLENFNVEMNRFDVVIIDEASQADMLALVALYLGKQVLIVGDNEQVSPLAVGERADDMERLAKQYLEDLPNSYLYTGKFSIYDLAEVSGYQPVRLKEHFRCVPEIIGYSNQVVYNNQIKALKDTGSIQPAVQTVYVKNGEEIDGVNKEEAREIVEALISCIKKPVYSDKTFGVISLKGDKQAAYIETLLQQELMPEQYEKHQILCGNSSHFQGDERDIIFISLVDSGKQEEMLRQVSYGQDNLHKKRYNVAMSRAKEQIWIMHSFDENTQLKEDDIRRELLTYCQQVQNKMRVTPDETSSMLMTQVKELLEPFNVTIQSNVSVGGYIIDLVVSAKEKKIGIILDDLITKDYFVFEEEMRKQAVLERVGWQLMNINPIDLHMSKDRLLSEIKKILP